MAEQDKLVSAYPKLKAYIENARLRGFTDEEIDVKISQGLSAARKKGKSIQEINDATGISPELSFAEKHGDKFPTLDTITSGFRGAPDVSNVDKQNFLAPIPKPEERHGTRAALDTAAYMGEATVGPFREGYKTLAQNIAVDTPRAISNATGLELGPAYAEAVGRGVLPGLDTNVDYEREYGLKGPEADFMRTTAWKGIPVFNPAAAAAAEQMGAAAFSKMGAAARPAAAAAELALLGPVDMMEQVPTKTLGTAWKPGDPLFKGIETTKTTVAPDITRPVTGPARPQGPMGDALLREQQWQFDPTTRASVEPSADFQALSRAPTPDAGNMLVRNPEFNAAEADKMLESDLFARRHNFQFNEKSSFPAIGPEGSVVNSRDAFRPQPIEDAKALAKPDFISQQLETVGPVKKGARQAEGLGKHYNNWLKKNKLQDSAENRAAFFDPARARGAGAEGKVGGQDIYRMRDVKFADGPLGGIEAGPMVNGEAELIPGIPYHTNRPTDIPRSEALARVPGNEVVDSTRMMDVRRGMVDPMVGTEGARVNDSLITVPTAVDRAGNSSNAGRGDFPFKPKINPAAFPDRLPVGDRQPGASGKVTVEGPYLERQQTATSRGTDNPKYIDTVVNRPVKMSGGETFVPERPFNRAGQELDPRKMQARAAAMQDDLTQARQVVLETEGRPTVAGLAGMRDSYERAGLEGRIGGRERPGLQDLAKRRESDALDDYLKKSGGFDSLLGGALARDFDSAVEAVVNKIKPVISAEGRAKHKALDRAVAKFGRAKSATAKKAEDSALALVRELREAVKSGKISEAEAKQISEWDQKLVKDMIGAENQVARKTYLEVARELFPEANRRDLLAQAGEVEALTKGLQSTLGDILLNTAGEGLRRGVNTFKTVKVLGSTTAYFNNVASNLISSYLAGVNPNDIGSLRIAVSDLVKRGDLYERALKDGLFGTEFFSKEVDSVLRELDIAAKKNKSAGEAIGHVWRTVTGSAASVYDGIDKAFKLGVYDTLIKRGMTGEQAVEHLNKFFPNYERIRGPLQRIRKNPLTALYVNPFIAFPVEYARVYKNALMDSTQSRVRLLGATAALGGAVAAGQYMTGERPGYHKFPGKFTAGRLDLTYMIPLADTLSGFSWNPADSTAKNVGGMIATAGKNIGLGGGGRGILSPTEERFRKPGQPLTEKAFNFLAPPVAIKLSQLGDKRAGGEDPGPLREAAEFAGVRLIPGEREEMRRARNEYEGRERSLVNDINRVRADKSLDRETKNARLATLREQLTQLKKSR